MRPSVLDRRPLLSMLFAFALIAVACGSNTTESSSSTETTTSSEPDEPEATSSEPDEPAQEGSVLEADASAVIDPDTGALEVLGQFQPLQPGLIYTDALGTRITAEIPDGIFVQPNSNGFFVLSDATSRGAGDRDLVFLRPSTLFDPAGGNSFTASEIDPDSLDDWLAAAPEHVRLGEVTDATVGGQPARSFSVTVDEFAECPENRRCVPFAGNATSLKELDPGFNYQVFLVEQDGEDPVMIVIGWQDLTAEWEAIALAILETLVFGETEPNPAAG